ncbi:hypothetical protein, partial [Nocardioides sp. NPDC047086]|uniref:hypothetical protein n=1 Tax=Nocardioides sp. NPDC047086 TaxID=3154810 RepID=UPI0033FA3F2A
VETNTVPSSAEGDRVGLDTPPPSGSGGSTSGGPDRAAGVRTDQRVSGPGIADAPPAVLAQAFRHGR